MDIVWFSFNCKMLKKHPSELARTVFGVKEKLDCGEYRNLIKLAVALDDAEASFYSEVSLFEHSRIKELKRGSG
jgi:hypothetical protein